MVVVKVRETYDLHTTKNKMTVIAIHTPKPDIIKRNYPGLLMQCKAYRPKSCSVRIACASVLPLDPQGVGLAQDDVAPEDIFNPILYSAMSNKGMSQLEARINYLSANAVGRDVDGSIASVEVDGTTNQVDEFPIYYGLLSETHRWKHANPQSGLAMDNLKPLVYEMVYNIGDAGNYHVAYPVSDSDYLPRAPQSDGSKQAIPVRGIPGKAKEMPFINCSAYSLVINEQVGQAGTYSPPGFALDSGGRSLNNCEVDVPWIPVVVGAIIVPPSRLHELFYRMTCVWEIEFSSVRPIGEITDWVGLANIGANTHYQNYSYSATKEALTGDAETMLTKDSTMVSSNVDVEKVM